jgi:hypothetical protein
MTWCSVNHRDFTLIVIVIIIIIIIIIIKGCSVFFIPILRHIFNLSLSQQYLPIVWKESAVVPIFKRGSHAAVSNYRPILFLSNFSKLFEFITHDHVLHYAKLNPSQHGFTKSRSTVTNLLTFFTLWRLLSAVSVKPMHFWSFKCFRPRLS